MKYFLRFLGVLIFLIIVGIVVKVNFPNLFNLSGTTSVLPAPVKVQKIDIQNDQVLSSDGTMKILMKKAGRNYSFFVSNADGKDSNLIFTKTVSLNNEITIPLNTFSPDNKYFFLKEKIGINNDVLVFKTSGSIFSNGQQYLTPVSIFEKGNFKYSIIDITGWDDPTLLHVKTTGPNFWFAVESSSFIQLYR